MQPFTVESINETLELFGVSPSTVRSAVDAADTASDAVNLISEAIAESPGGAVIELGDTLQEGLDALVVSCHRCGVGLTSSGNVVEVSRGSDVRTFSEVYRQSEDSFNPVMHAVEKAVDGHLRIFPLRSTLGADCQTFAVLTKHDWERLLRTLGAPAFNILFVGLDGKPIV